tara:strand:- start:13 stop:690 length:678 start_codon:yes stop_codon:yes gene_type:complete
MTWHKGSIEAANSAIRLRHLKGTIMTLATFTKSLATAGEKLGVTSLTTIEAGGIGKAYEFGSKLENIYAAMWAADVRPSDYLSYKNKESTASKEQYEERGKVAALACYTVAERKELAGKLPKDATPEAKASRKTLQDRKTELLKTVRRGLETQAKLHDPDAGNKGPDNRKEAIEKLGIAFDTALKILQGDGLPEWFNTPDCTAVLLAAQKKYKVPAKAKSIDDLL